MATNHEGVKHHVELSEVSAELSQRITTWNPLYIKATGMVDERTLEVTPSRTPVPFDKFWAAHLGDVELTPAQREKLHLQLHRSNGCHENVLVFVLALQELCDSGVSLAHEGQPVVDIWVMNTTEFDVSDILETRVIRLKDPISDVIIDAVSTYENKDRLRTLGSDIARRVGLEVLPLDPLEETIKYGRPSSYRGAIPHWWVAAIVEGERLGARERRMVHVDICGAAYDDNAFKIHKDSLVSLQMFCTPEYELSPSRILKQELRHKFTLSPCTRATHGKRGSGVLSLQPWSVRHLRCFHRKDSSTVEVTPINMFVGRNTKFQSEKIETLFKLVADLRERLVRGVPAGAEVIVSNLKSRPELNGRKGRVHESVATNRPVDRIPVWVEGVGNPLSLKTSSICFTSRKQYLSCTELLRSIEAPPPQLTEELPPVSNVDVDVTAIRKMLEGDADVAQVFGMIGSGKVTISCFGDAGFVRGMKKLLAPPCDQLMPREMVERMQGGLQVAEHPKAKEAFAILHMLKKGKQRALQDSPESLRGDGGFALAWGSDYHQLLVKVAEKIRRDEGLMDVFEIMEANGDYPNPANQIGALQNIAM